MSDQELIKLLRRMSPRLDALDCENVLTAADRIEKVVKERDGLLRVVTDNHVALQRAEAAEAKLTKAAEEMRWALPILEKYQAHPNDIWALDDFRAVLAELEGEG